MHCRFENRITGQAIILDGFLYRLDAATPDELSHVVQGIEDALVQGHWVALVADYELGEWLEPGVLATPRPEHAAALPARPRLTALVFAKQRTEAPWGPAEQTCDTPLQWSPVIDRATYRAHIEHLRQGIARGDYYQVNYTFPIDIQTTLPADQLYRHIAHHHRSAHAAFIELGDDASPERAVLSFSPELFVERTGAELTVRPMKGTAPRHTDPQQDQQSAHELQASIKNQAENLMIVDLLRNDLGRIATPGSVHVPALFSLEQYPSVWTLTSTITAHAPETPLHTLLHALFPCGSITGAPKIAAMQAIRSLETSERGIYCGSLGWIAPSGDFSLNVAIRTIEMTSAGRGRFGVGGGIVFDSDPDEEWEESLWKARVLGA